MLASFYVSLTQASDLRVTSTEKMLPKDPAGKPVGQFLN